MVNCRRRKKYGGGVVWDRMKKGAENWNDVGKKGMANMKAAQERAKMEGAVLANSYKNQKTANTMSVMPAMPSAMPAMPTAMAATGGRRRRRSRKKKKFKKHYMWNTKGKRYMAKTYKQHIKGVKLGHTHKKPKKKRKSKKKSRRRRR
jgi:hypothetical protein